VGVSGNGAHAVFRCNIRPDEGWHDGAGILYRGIESAFRGLFEDCRIHFDIVVRNPGRIWRLYGFTNRKGEPTAERPHRKAEVSLPPAGWRCVEPSALNRVIALWRPSVERIERHERIERNAAAPVGTGDYSTLDIVAWLQSHGLYIRPLSGIAHAVRCPWRAEHSSKGGGSETVIFEPSGGGPGFHCHHAHCSGRSIRELMALFGDADAFCACQFEGGRRHG
jgi:hypothetical protein